MANLYECEIQRNNISPKQFFTYCKNQLKNKGIDIENWVEFENWESPITLCNMISNNEDWEKPQKEVCKILPYNWHLFLGETYNFIIEFDFWNENKGFGYLYVMEYEV